MPSAEPCVVIRLGSHAEKDYFLKTVKYWDGLVVGANLLEAAPGATSSLILKFAGAANKVPYYVDPMTYAFGTYVRDGRRQTDLDWIKSDQKNRTTKQTERLFKSSYLKLAAVVGAALEEALRRGRGIATLDTGQVKELAQAVLAYQMTRVRSEFASDPEYSEEADAVPSPAALFAPYFYVDPRNAVSDLRLFEECAAAGSLLKLGPPVHAVLCTDVEALDSVDFLDSAAQAIRRSGVAGVWLWFSRFKEEQAKPEHLLGFRRFVEELAKDVAVYNMHGGYFSLALSRFGLRGVSHGVGYGEQKDVMPVVGQSTPTVRYYLPHVKRKLGVPEIERSFSGIGVTTPEEFFAKICDCAICKGVIGSDINNFSSFGELHYSRKESQRRNQTPAAAQRCRFHFLLSRIKERNQLRTQTAPEIAAELGLAYDKWVRQRTIERDIAHLPLWKKVFEIV